MFRDISSRERLEPACITLDDHPTDSHYHSTNIADCIVLAYPFIGALGLKARYAWLTLTIYK